MAKKLSLDQSVMSKFHELLRGSVGFGGLVDDRLAGGQLWVWVPEALTSIDLHRIREDIFFPDSFEMDKERFQTIGEFLNSEPTGVAIADTVYEPSETRPDWFSALEWFTVKSPQTSDRDRLCVFLRNSQFSQNSYDALFHAASPYPTTITLTSVGADKGLSSGMDLNSKSAALQGLLDRVEHVFVGAFDERSMLGWSRRRSDF